MKKTLISVMLVLGVLLGSLLSPMEAQARHDEGVWQIGGNVGLGVSNKEPNPTLDIGLLGDYFMWDKISLGGRVDLFTDFDASFVTFVPKVGYHHDLNDDWTLYGNAGLGYAVGFGAGSTNSFFDLALPGGGIAYHFNDDMSIAADMNMHILIGNITAVVFSFGPQFRYSF